MESHKYIFRQFGCSRLSDKMFYPITVYVEGKISNLSSSLYHRREIKIEGRIIWIVNRLKLILWFCEIQINMESLYCVSFWHWLEFRIKVSRRDLVLLISFAIYIKINFFCFLTIYFLIYRCSLTFFVKKYISYVSNNY